MPSVSAEHRLEQRLAYVTLAERAATAANEFETLEAAAQAILDEVCQFTGWPVGHLYASTGPRSVGLEPTSTWHLDDAERFETLRRVTEASPLGVGEGLPGRVVATRRPAWITDIYADANFPRAAMAADLGVRAAFAFPVMSGPDVAAVLEFFSESAAEPDPDLLEAMASVGRLLGRVVDRQRAELALRQSEERFRALAESAADAIVAADQRGVIVSWNPAAERIFGYPRAQALGQSLTMLMPPRFQDAHRAGLDRFLATGEGPVMGRTIELAGRRRDGTEFPLELSLSTWQTLEGRFFTGIIRDVTERNRAAEERRAFEEGLADRALRDQLTGLPNRALMLDRLEHALARAGRQGSSLAVLSLDLDRFKSVNDSFGRPVGDELLLAVAERMTALQRPGDTVAHMGGDGFAVLWEDIDGREDAVRLAEHVLAAFERPFQLPGNRITASASAGVAVAAQGGGGRHAEGLLREADAAMFRAKQRGRGAYEVFDEAMRAQAARRQATEDDLRRALGTGQLRLHYQPIVALDSGHLEGVEALLRWEHPVRGDVSPGEFIPLAEETGIIGPLGLWVLEESCRQAAAWQSRRPPRSPLTINVNVSMQQFERDGWIEEVGHALAQAGLAPPCLVVEITESMLMQDTEAAGLRLAELRRLGVRVAIDDFGTGYSSLGYLRQLPIDILKIDKSFIDGVAEGPHDSALARAVVKLAKTLGLVAIAEGIERREQLTKLRRLACPLGQGFYLGRPQPPDEITTLLAAAAAAPGPATAEPPADEPDAGRPAPGGLPMLETRPPARRTT